MLLKSQPLNTNDKINFNCNIVYMYQLVNFQHRSAEILIAQVFCQVVVPSKVVAPTLQVHDDYRLADPVNRFK